MSNNNGQHVVWERRQAELWDRIFQVTQDVVTLSESVEATEGQVVLREQLMKSAMGVGAKLVRANAADRASDFEFYLNEARLSAIETDYWLRLLYVLQQRDEVQRDLSSIITQYAAIISMLHNFIKHTNEEPGVIAKHAKGPKINL